MLHENRFFSLPTQIKIIKGKLNVLKARNKMTLILTILPEEVCNFFETFTTQDSKIRMFLKCQMQEL
jgi:hypothetical protein